MKIKNTNIKIFKISLLLLGIGILLTFGVNTSAATTSSGIYVNGSSGNDNWDGLNSAYTSGSSGPKATIKNATDTVNTNGTIYITNGIYNENNIQITTNMTIIGEKQSKTIIDAQGNGNIFYIAPGINLILINITLRNGNNTLNPDTDNGGAIWNDGTLTVTNDTFTNNTSGDGGAIYNDGTVTGTNDTFNNNTSYGNGGAIYNSGTLSATNDTFNNNTSDNYGGAIYNSGTLTETNDTFNNNTAQSGLGGAIYNFFGCTLTETNDTFNNNTATRGGGGAITNDGTLTMNHDIFNNNSDYDYGGAIKNFGTLTCTNDTFNNNTANYGGGAIFNSGTLNITNDTFNKNNASNYGIGGAIINSGTLTVNNCTFTKNTAINGGGAIYNQGNLSVNNSTYTENTAIDGGAIQNGGTLDVEGSSFLNNSADVGNTFYINLSKHKFPIDLHFNRIVGDNTSVELYSEGDRDVNATFNWWGSNNPVNVTNDADVTYNPWIVLTVTATPKTINNGDKSTVTADLLHDNEDNYLDPVNGHVPDGISVKFQSDQLGTLNPTTNTTSNGSTNTTFTAHSNGVSKVSTTVDNQTLTTDITINKIPSAYLYLLITSSNNNPKVNEPFTITYKLGNNGPDSASNVTMTIPLPSDFILTNITGDGNWTINKTTNIITWTLTNVTVGDPYLYITGNINKNGVYVFGSNITSETYNLNTQGVTPITITSTNPVNPTRPTTPNTKTTLNADTTKIPMQHTGLPITGLILAILSVLGGSIMSRKK